MRRVFLAGGTVLLLAMGLALPSHATLITFDDLVNSDREYRVDVDGDMFGDVIFSGNGPAGFNRFELGWSEMFIDDPGLEGNSLVDPDLRVDFLGGATGTLSFGFAVTSFISNPNYFGDGNVDLYDANDVLIAHASAPALFFDLGDGTMSFIAENEIEVTFSGVASYAIFDFSGQFGRFVIDNFDGTFGSAPVVPEPASITLVGLGLAGIVYRRRRT